MTMSGRSSAAAGLTQSTLARAVRDLCARDPDLATIVTSIGPPPMWARRPGFATLLRIVLEQQVSLASARATFARLQKASGRVTAARIAALSVPQLQRHGLTRQKADYCSNLARLIVDGELDLRDVARADDVAARNALIQVRGIGRWTADVYLLMALRRPDVWPDGDLALAEAARRIKRLRTRPRDDRLRRIAAAWKPWRSVAARLLWHHYLSTPR